MKNLLITVALTGFIAGSMLSTPVLAQIATSNMPVVQGKQAQNPAQMQNAWKNMSPEQRREWINAHPEAVKRIKQRPPKTGAAVPNGNKE